MKNIIAVLIGLLVCTSAFSNPTQIPVWQDVVAPNAQLQYRSLNPIASNEQGFKRRSLNLNESEFKQRIGFNKLIGQGSLNAKSAATEIDLPLPNGGFARVRVIESPILSPEQAKNHPEIKTWRVEGVDNPAISGRLDFTSQGFHGMLVLEDGDTVYIDPDKEQRGNLYHSLSKRDNPTHFKENLNCQVHGEHAALSALESKADTQHLRNKMRNKMQSKKLAQIPALDLITYRLAVAGTAEYTASQGGTKASAYASMVTTINRVNEIYRRDLGITLQLVSGEQLVYTDASTDPYTNDDASLLVDENMENLFTNFDVIYDIGHVFAQGPLGGLAYVGVACLNTVNTPSGIVNGLMAGGATGIPNPQGEIFSINFVAHEIGHQLGATHTFNSTKKACAGSRTPESAVEPGSGSTIMSYSSICGSDNLQHGADAMFHRASISQINSYTRSSHGASCGAFSATGNQKPVANAGVDIKIPLLTPFFLDGSATGGSSYTWDQMDTGSASSVDVDMGDNALIRTTLPSSNPDRTIPRLSDLFGSTSTLGEKLPQTVRALNFAFVVRDGSGGVGSDDKKVSTVDTGGTFKVLSQSSPKILSTGKSVDIAWQVAGTNNAPVSCNTVDIKLIRKNGVENVLLANTGNDGNASLVVPASTPEMSDARIMVACSNRSFFQLSSGAITVKKGSATDTVAPVITITGSPAVSISKGSNYADAGAKALDNIDGVTNVTTSGSVNTAVVGTYTMTYTATDSSNNTATAIRTVVVMPTAVADTTAPTITIIGASIVSVKQNETYADKGATATDNIDSVVSVSKTGTVNTAALGSYTITYTARDTAGNIATKKRTVKVVKKIIPDTKAPVITLSGKASITLGLGKAFTEPGYSALDEQDGVVKVVVTGKVNIKKAGTYVLNYSATDVAGNTAKKKRTIIIAKKSDSGSKSEAKSSGGSMGLLLLPLALAGLRRRRLGGYNH